MRRSALPEKAHDSRLPLGAFSFGGLDGVQTVLGGVRAYSKGSTLLLPHVPGSLRAWLTALRWFGQREAFTAAQHLGLFRVMTFSSNITRTVIRSCRRVSTGGASPKHLRRLHEAGPGRIIRSGKGRFRRRA
jgi:hypothetical protein